MSQPYLFYSERCPHSKQIIETLKALNKAGLYKFILVETLARDKIPPFLQKVPTLYNPDSKEVIVGKDIFGYIAKPTNARKEHPVKEEPKPVDVSAWGFEGSGRLSEAYSSWDSPTSFVAEGNSMYTFLNEQMSKPQNTLPEKPEVTGEIGARLKAMEQERKNEFSGIKRT
jgi:hypothetical protein